MTDLFSHLMVMKEGKSQRNAGHIDIRICHAYEHGICRIASLFPTVLVTKAGKDCCNTVFMNMAGRIAGFTQQCW